MVILSVCVEAILLSVLRGENHADFKTILWLQMFPDPFPDPRKQNTVE